MDPALNRLTKLVPPPADPPFRAVDWVRLEAGLGVTYPTSFKEFVGVYGGCVWFDRLGPFYSPAKTRADVTRFGRAVRRRLEYLEGNLYDEHYRPIDLPLYPEPGGLFPFMMDRHTSAQYFWRTGRGDPDRWPVVCWFKGPVRVLEGMTLAKMLLDWLERRPRMVKVWGDVRPVLLGLVLSKG